MCSLLYFSYTSMKLRKKKKKVSAFITVTALENILTPSPYLLRYQGQYQ